MHFYLRAPTSPLHCLYLLANRVRPSKVFFLLTTALYVVSFCILSTVTHVSFRLHSLWNYVHWKKNFVFCYFEFSLKILEAFSHTRHNAIIIANIHICDWWHCGTACSVDVSQIQGQVDSPELVVLPVFCIFFPCLCEFLLFCYDLHNICW